MGPQLVRWVFRCLLLDEIGQIIIALGNLPTNFPFTAAIRQGCCLVSPCRGALPNILPRSKRRASTPSWPTLWFAAVKYKRSENNVVPALFPKAWMRGNYESGRNITDEPPFW